jgi:hypothetical protein
MRLSPAVTTPKVQAPVAVALLSGSFAQLLPRPDGDPAAADTIHHMWRQM